MKYAVGQVWERDGRRRKIVFMTNPRWIVWSDAAWEGKWTHGQTIDVWHRWASKATLIGGKDEMKAKDLHRLVKDYPEVWGVDARGMATPLQFIEGGWALGFDRITPTYAELILLALFQTAAECGIEVASAHLGTYVAFTYKDSICTEAQPSRLHAAVAAYERKKANG